MKIGIDARLLSTKIRGTARYLLNLIEYLLFQYEDLPQNNSFYNYIKKKVNFLVKFMNIFG